MLYAPGKEINDSEGHIHPEAKSRDRYWNDDVHELNFDIRALSLTASKATWAPCSNNFPSIQPFRPDTC